MAGITSGGVAAWSGGRSASARRPWRPQERKKRASSPRWPLDEVERVGEEKRCGLPARKKRK
jgi:hypothetical protein